jgi:hypothetical protein
MLAELLHRPFAAVTVALDARDAIAPKQFSEFADGGFGRERRRDLPDGVNHRQLSFAVGDGQRHRVTAATARVDKCAIRDVR